MSYVIINENKYIIPEVDFDAVCELEENGVNLLNMNKNNVKIATMARGLVAWVMGADVKTASRELEAHIANGGNIVDIISRVSDALQNSSFFSQNRPQDHRKKGGKYQDKVRQYPGNPNQHQGNRAQRRANSRNRNRNNGNR